MKRIVRLTERDLSRIVKRVIKEQQEDIATQITQCATEVLTLSDLSSIPTCLELATETMTQKKIPTDFMKGMKCVGELTSLKKGPQDAMKFFKCILDKINNPVMN